MISMSDVHSIRQSRRSGESVAAIAREVGVSRDAVYKCLRMEGLSPKMPAPAEPRPSKLDPCKQLVEQAARRRRARTAQAAPYRQAHTAAARRGMRPERLGGRGGAVREGVARATPHAARPAPRPRLGPGRGAGRLRGGGLLPARHAHAPGLLRRHVPVFQRGPGAAVSRRERGVRVRGVQARDRARRRRAVEDRARQRGGRGQARRGRGARHRAVPRLRSPLRLLVLLLQFAAGQREGRRGEQGRHDTPPAVRSRSAGRRRGRLQRAAAGPLHGALRQAAPAEGRAGARLFVEDRVALSGLPPKPFSCVRYASARADEQGKVRFGGPRLYSTDPALAGRDLVIAAGAAEISVYDGAVPTDTSDPASQLPLLCVKVGAWPDS